MKTIQKKEHPEVKDIKNICDVTPKNNHTKNICDKLNKEKPSKKN